MSAYSRRCVAPPRSAFASLRTRPAAGVFVLLSFLHFSLAFSAGSVWAEAPNGPVNRWEPKIRAFEAEDRREMPRSGGILFVGSSSIVGWDLPTYFPDLPTINRGFGGSQIADSVHFADRIIVPYRPRIVVLYAGDNDVAAGKSPEEVAADYARFVATVHESLPKTRIVFVAIKPSARRWKLVAAMREANRRIHEVTEKEDRLTFVDIDGPMLGDDGKPRPELFRDDGLHLNAAGYRLWSSLVRPHLIQKH